MIVRVGERMFGVRKHALERYGERVKPMLTGNDLARDLARVLEQAGDVQRWAPSWAIVRGETDTWVTIGDDIAFPVANGEMITCVTRGAPGDENRANRSEVRRERSENDRRPGARKKHGKVARAERARARRQAEAFDG